MSVIKQPYEISVWEDVIVYVGTPSGNEYSSITDMTGTGDTVDYQYYTERELAIIGSSTMTSPARTINNIFKRNINGVETLTFDMYYQNEDIDEGQIVHNPLIDLVIDERKVKLHYDDKWYDFIVKKDDEKGRDYKYSFTCTGLAANELGKTGFNIELDTELENNTGTVQELGAAILEGSDWQLAQSGQEVIQQTNDEALYLIQLNTNITGTIRGSNTTKTINSGSWIYVYYTSYINQVENYFQFIYVDKSNGLGIPDLYEDKITIYCNNISNGTYDLYINNVSWADGKPSFEQSNTKTIANYRGRRHVRKQLMDYDPVLEQTVYKYKKPSDNNKIYYGYTTTEYLDIETVTNYIYNSINFGGTSYWSSHNNASLQAKVFPDVTPAPVNPESDEYKPYLIVNFQTNTNKTASRVVNEGIVQNYSRINRFEKGEKYRFKVWVGTASGNEVNSTSIPFKCVVKKYTTIDEDKDSDTLYFVFDGAIIPAENGYYYTDAVCRESATWEDLDSYIGIFLYPRGDDNLNINYYIKDIQLYRYIQAEDGHVLNIGEVPEVRIITNYHFYDPDFNAGFTSAADYKFSDNNKNLYVPLYGSGDNEFEKVRSITAKESNRFNLLQELSETFECWVKFEVVHESNGQIGIENYPYYKPVEITQSQWQANTYYIYNQTSKEYQLSNSYDNNKKYFLSVNRKRQSKKVVFYGEILQENFVGFKYGINLKDNNRTLDSEQIATKIIVKDNSCEAAENGFCSISRAKDNPIKENFALNLDYYVTQGLINGSNLNNDLYLELNGSIGLYPRLSRYNKERDSLIDKSGLQANSISRLISRYTAAQLLYDDSSKSLSKLLDRQSGEIVRLTGYQYEDFSNQYNRTINHSNIPAYSNEIYYVAADIVDVQPAPSIICIRSNDAVPVSGATYYTIENNRFEVFEGTKFFNTKVYYKRTTGYRAGTYFQTSNNTTTLTFTGNNSSVVYIYNAARQIMEVDSDDYINSTGAVRYITEAVTLIKQKNTASEELNDVEQALNDEQEEYNTIKVQLQDIAKATEEIEKEFNTKYSRYIQEGSWTDDNYMDDDLYYFDALDVLYQSAYPKVSYNFKVLELSQLEGYEAFKFDIGHKTYVEDTEFFGYYWGANGAKTPVRETVVVTEATLNLDEPEKNDLKVQNYKSHFEDLFQRITAATQSLEYHSGEYGRAAAAINSNGTVDESVLQKSLATSAYIIQNAHDQSVVWGDEGIQVTNLSDPAQVIRLTSGGILVSADGGQNWGIAITGYGINANYINAGTIDADKINIMSGAYPTFKWDALGLRAYQFQTNNGVIYSYNPASYVTYDRWGIYGMNGYLVPPELESVADVEDKAIFALTWNGLFIKSTHRDGYVRISPTEDIVLKEYQENGTDITRAKFGLISPPNASEEIYGLALYGPELDENNKPIPTVETKSDGTLWLKSQMDIGDQTTNSIYIGVGQEATPAEQAKYGSDHGKKVFTVHGAAYIDPETGQSGGSTTLDRFTVYEDGYVVSHGNYIDGPLKVTEGGQIGNMTVQGLVNTVGVRISPGSASFRLDNGAASPSSMTFEYKSGFTEIGYLWQWGSSLNSLSNVPSAFISNKKVTFSYDNVSSIISSGVMYLRVTVTADDNQTYMDTIIINYVEDGESGTSITVTSVQYGYNDSGISHSDVTWSDNIPNVPAGYWLWVKTGYSDGTYIYTSTYNGVNGQNGQDGTAYTYSIESSAGTIINTANITRPS